MKLVKAPSAGSHTILRAPRFLRMVAGNRTRGETISDRFPFVVTNSSELSNRRECTGGVSTLGVSGARFD